MSNFNILILYLLLALFLIGCQKEFLNFKSNKTNVIPISLMDYESLLDNSNIMNYSSSHELAQISTDEYLIEEEQWNLLSSPMEKNAYVWNKEIFEGVDCPDWNNAYRRILYANIVLEGLNNIEKDNANKEKWNTIKGRALFFRSISFFELSQLFCDVYEVHTAQEKLGIPLRLESDINLISTRSTLKETYDQIIKDLNLASKLLSDFEPIKQRPTKQAANSLLARVFLQIGSYKEALLHANIALEMGGRLIDYNTIDVNARYPFPPQGINNPEVIFLSRVGTNSIINSLRFNANRNFFDHYSDNDLRKEAFFYENIDGRLFFKGSYNGEYHCFTGLAFDELVLISAECLVRVGENKKALEKLFVFQKNRYKSGSVKEIESDDSEFILKIILEERLKELYRRGLYWGDLKRLNKEERFKRTLVRNLKDRRYELPPLDARYIFPIPDDVIKLGKLEQNVR